MPCSKRSTRRKFYGSKPCDKLVATKNRLGSCCYQTDIPYLKNVSAIYTHKTRTTEEGSPFMDEVVEYIRKYHMPSDDDEVGIRPMTEKGMNLLILAEKFRSNVPLNIYLTKESGFMPLPDSAGHVTYIVQDLQDIKVPSNKMMTITGNTSSVVYGSIDYFDNSSEDIVKRVKGLTYLKVDVPLVTTISEAGLLRDVVTKMIDLGKLIANDIVFTRTAFNFTFVSSTLSSADSIRSSLIDMPFEDYPKGSLYQEQVGDRRITIQIVNSQYRDVACTLKVEQEESVEQIATRESVERTRIELVSQQLRERDSLNTRQQTAINALELSREDVSYISQDILQVLRQQGTPVHESSLQMLNEPTEDEMTTHILEQEYLDAKRVIGGTYTRLEYRNLLNNVKKAEQNLKEWEKRFPLTSSLLTPSLNAVESTKQKDRLAIGAVRIMRAGREQGSNEERNKRLERIRYQKNRSGADPHFALREASKQVLLAIGISTHELKGFFAHKNVVNARKVYTAAFSIRGNLTTAHARVIENASSEKAKTEYQLGEWEKKDRLLGNFMEASLLSRSSYTQRETHFIQQRTERSEMVINEYYTLLLSDQTQEPGQEQPQQNTSVPLVEPRPSRRIPRSIPPETVPSRLPIVNVPKLPTQSGDKDMLMNSMATDIITFEEMSVSAYLEQDAKNMILFESNFKPHFTNIDDLRVAMEDGIVYGCKKVSTRLRQTLSNVDVKTELFNARRIGPLSGYIDAKNLKSAIHSVQEGLSSRMFLITESVRDVPAVISKKVFNQMDDLVSANHCQAGAEGSVHNVIQFVF